MRLNRNEPLVDQVKLLYANPQYVHVQLPDGREDTVSLTDLALAGNESGLTSQSEGCPQDTSTDLEETEI